MNIKRRYFALAGAAATAAGLALAVAPAAQAVTTACATNGFCGTQVNFHDGLVFDVFRGVAASNNKVIAYPNGNDRATDFINYHPTSGPVTADENIKAFEYAPGDHPSGLCLSDPGPGFGATDLIVLRPCNNSRFQTWRPIEDTTHSGWFSWRNMASNQFITDNGIRSQLTDIKDGSVGLPNNNQPSGAENQLWRFTQSTAAFAS